MKPTRVTLRKLAWLINSKGFRAHPIKTVMRVIGWELLRILGRPRVFRFDDSLRIKVYPNDGVGRLTYYFGYHEVEIFHFLRNFLEPGMTFIDVGANIGVYTMFAAKRVGPTGKVFAFEPEGSTFAKLQENVKVNGLRNVVVERLAVGEAESKLEIIKNSDTAKTYTRVITPGALRESNSCEDICDCISLDTYFTSQRINRIDYLKIDVEGFEYNVLKGAAGIMERMIPSIIQLELYDELLARNGSSIEAIVSFMRNIGYQFFRLGMSTRLVPLGAERPTGDVFIIHGGKLHQLSCLLG